MGVNRIGFVNGCFDILHLGHKRLLEFAKNHCDYLIVAIDEDVRVKELKGSDRPFNPFEDRKEMLSAFSYVDEVVGFSSRNALSSLIKSINPDIMVIGSDYREQEVIGSQYAKELVFFDRIEGYSTSKIVERSCCG